MAEPETILNRLSPVPADFMIEPSFAIVVVPLLTVTVKSVLKSIVPVLLMEPPIRRVALLANSMVPELFRVPVRSLFLKRSLNIKKPVLPIASSPAISPPRNTKLPLLILLPEVKVCVPLPIRNAFGPAPPVAAKFAA